MTKIKRFSRLFTALLAALVLAVGLFSQISAKAATKYGVTVPTASKALSGYDAIYGVDVSRYQEEIDWAKVKKAGIKYAIIRLGFRGYGSTGNLVVDDNYRKNIQGALDAGLEVGVYFYTQAVNTKEAAAEADLCIKNLKGFAITLPVYYDIEEVTYDTGRLDSAKLSKAEKTALCRAFAERIESAGYDAGIYTNKNWFETAIDGEALGEDYEIWLAHYTTNTTYAGFYNMWQFTSSASVSGISGSVDLNVRYAILPETPDCLEYEITGVQNAELVWDPVRFAKAYQVKQINAATGKETLLGETADTTMQVQYSPQAENRYRVYAVYPFAGKTYAGNAAEVVIPAGMTEGNYPAPEGLKRTSAGTNSIKLQWNAVEGAAGYRVFVFNVKTGEYQDCTEVTGTSVTIKGLSTMTAYRFRVSALFDASGETVAGLASEEISTGTLPKTPQNLTVSSCTETSQVLTWDKVSGIKTYAVYKKNPTSGKFERLATTKTNSYTVTGLTAATEYEYKVRAYYAGEEANIYSGYSEALAYHTHPKSVKNLAVSSYTATTVKLTWKKGGACDGYRIYVYNSSIKDYTYIKTVTTESATLTGLSKNKTYKFKVNEYVNNGSSRLLASGITIQAATKPTAPANFTVKASSPSTIRLAWSGVSGATQYRIYYYDTKTKKHTYIGSTTSKEYLVKNLKRNKTYTFSIRAVKDVAGTLFYGTYTDGLKASTAPNYAKDLQYTSCTTSSITMKWTGASGVTGYWVYKQNTATGQFEKYLSTTDTSLTIKNLTTAQRDTYKVRAYKTVAGRNYYSEYTNEIEITTRPAQVSGLTLKKSGKTVVVSWKKVARSSAYEVCRYDPKTKKYTRIAVVSCKNLTYTIKNPNNTERIAVRAYKVADDVRYYGKFSEVKTIKK